jgi:ABC-type branched-subunit amino acid transport system substrate-binding protein
MRGLRMLVASAASSRAFFHTPGWRADDKLATEEVNKTGGVLGRPIELIIEDDQTTNPGSVLAFSKLAGDKDISVFIGPVHSTQVHAVHAMAPEIQRVGKPVLIGGADPQLTHMGNPWLFRCRPNDTFILTGTLLRNHFQLLRVPHSD